MFNSILLQIVSAGAEVISHTADSVTAATATTVTPTPQASLSLLDLIVKGGIIMIPMAVLSIITVYYFFERLITIRNASKLEANFMNNIKDLIHSGNIDGAKALCKNINSPIARIIEKGVSRIGKPIKQIEESMEGIGKLEVNRLEKNLGTLALIGRIAPIFGFIGTIAGVIKIFYDISLTDNISIGVISTGLYQKMITSATGLVIGLIAFIGYYVLNAMLDKIINKMEESSILFLDILNEPSK
jgi:biopolymer transport protein ExbB